MSRVSLAFTRGNTSSGCAYRRHKRRNFRLRFHAVLLKPSRYVNAEWLKGIHDFPDIRRRDAARDQHGLRDACDLLCRFLPAKRLPRTACRALT